MTRREMLVAALAAPVAHLRLAKPLDTTGPRNRNLRRRAARIGEALAACASFDNAMLARFVEFTKTRPRPRPSEVPPPMPGDPVRAKLEHELRAVLFGFGPDTIGRYARIARIFV